MIIVLFHVLYLLGKFVYQNYNVNKRKGINDAVTDTKKRFEISERDYMMKDPEAPQDYEEKSVRFFPPAYLQRYVAVSDVLNSPKYQGKLRKVVDFGCAELDFLVYLKNTPGIEEILCVDIDRSILESRKEKGAPLISEYIRARTTPLLIEICEGSVTHNDKKLEKTDAVVCIELIEHLYPDTLRDFPYNVFGFIKPKVAIITTPNADFNVLFPNFSGFRHPDHKFEWTRQQFQEWAEDIVSRYSDYAVTFDGICNGPEGTEHLGACSQMAIFHRLSDYNDCYGLSVEGLFKTVTVYEYPFHVDNRSDEQKILDEATYYIRQLSYQDVDMEEEVPLGKLLDMLKSFHISIDALQTILEEAGWSIASREFGPVVLVPPRTVFSDYSVAEGARWSSGYTTTDEDDWDVEPGAPANSFRYLEREIWDNENWDEEPSIVIPQNNSIVEDNTYLYDGENVVLDSVSETRRDFEPLEKHTEVSGNENLELNPSISSNTDRMSVDDLNDSFNQSVPSDLNESAVLSDSSCSMKLKDIKEYSSGDLIRSPSTREAAMSSSAQKLSRMLDFQAYMSTSRASTSPDQYLLQTVKMNQHSKNDSMLNESMSGYWMLNNSFEQMDVSKEKKSSSTNDLDDQHNIHSIYLNKSYKESEDSGSETVNSCTNAGTSVQDDNPLMEDQFQLNSSISLTTSSIIDKQPKFTSSPKVGLKVNTTSKKRRSLNPCEGRDIDDSSSTIKRFQLTRLSSNNTLEGSSEAFLHNNDTNTHITSTVPCSVVDERHNENEASTSKVVVQTLSVDHDAMDYSNDATLTGSSLSIADFTWNNDSRSTEESCVTNCSSNNASISHAQSMNCDNKRFPLADQESLVHQEENRKTERVSDLQKSIYENVDSTENSRPYAKDVANLRNISLVFSGPTGNVQSTSVLKNAKQDECTVEKGKDTNAPAEGPEAQPISPEAVETPPNSWSPEVMDSGYPNSASAQDMTPEYDLSSIAQDHISDSEPPSIAEAPRLGVHEVVEVENGDLANNNRDGEGNNMMPAQLNELEDLQPLIDVLENDIENENDIYALENDFPMWLLRILDMANPVEMQIRDRRDPRFPERAGDARYRNVEHDEGFDSSSEEGMDLEQNEIVDDDNSDVNENPAVDSENASNSDTGSERWPTGDT
ncbi:PREDICTED: uncharacterized protein LOC107189628 isoform X2 [Dufourea novaeangliae]|uniref:uncharacterized protein LOC107189628 isoform X2 n=1 Tax=Dufourea novaeangliae TaxID=178035 RepID=UPI00076755DB|nr:PREDICTED: uncharacterized protein LOC107189628 isoform X2 [Dufourea novaeangliae]